jgi:hypothetical protein
MFITDIFKESGLRYAIIGSVIWHFFWFFVIEVDLSPKYIQPHKKTSISFIGSVLSYESLNMILENKPELSKTEYQLPEDAGEILEPDIEPLGRMSPNDLVSMPAIGKQAAQSLHGALAKTKEMPDHIFYEKLIVNINKSPFPVTGKLASREIFQVPDKPDPALFAEFGVEPDILSEIEFEVVVNKRGMVEQIQIMNSSGHPDVDLIWQDYISEWQFMPIDSEFGNDETGRIRIKHQYGNGTKSTI